MNWGQERKITASFLKTAFPAGLESQTNCSFHKMLDLISQLDKFILDLKGTHRGQTSAKTNRSLVQPSAIIMKVKKIS